MLYNKLDVWDHFPLLCILGKLIITRKLSCTLFFFEKVVKWCSILYGCFYIRREFAFACAAMHHTDRNFQRLMFRNIYGHNGINDMTFFCDTSRSFTHFIMRTATAGGWHMFNGFVRCGYHSKMCSRMSFLTAGLFTGWPA